MSDTGSDAPIEDLDGVELALTICGAEDDQIESIIREGFTGMADLVTLEEKDIENMMTNITRLPIDRGGSRIGALLTKKVKALAFWCKERERKGENLDANEFDEDKLKNVLERMRVESIEDETKPELPSKFEPHKWVAWVKKVENYLWQVKGWNETPLIYVI